jgi:hypothetical protein
MRSPKRAGEEAPKVPRAGQITRYPNFPHGPHMVETTATGQNKLRTSRKVVFWESVCDRIGMGSAAEIDRKGAAGQLLPKVVLSCSRVERDEADVP